MPKAKNPTVSEAEALFREGLQLKEIAARLQLPEGTVRSWKNRYKWECNATQKKECNVAKKNVAKKAAVADKVEAVMQNPELTEKQRIFCVYYTKSFNATRAYQKAYDCSYETAGSNGYALLQNTAIQDEIKRLKMEKYANAFLSPEDIFQKYMDIAFSDITDYVDFRQEKQQVMSAFGPVFMKDEATGEKIPITQTVNVVRFKESTEVDGSIIQEVSQGKGSVKIKLADRMKALEWLADHMDMATEEQRARIENIKAGTAKIKGEDPEEDKGDDGFIAALKGEAAQVWQE